MITIQTHPIILYVSGKIHKLSLSINRLSRSVFLGFTLSGQASTSQQSNASGAESTHNNISSNSSESASENNTSGGGGGGGRRLRDDVEFDFD
jgi:hypothetical protein